MDDRLLDLERRIERLEDALRTFMSSPKSDEIGSPQKAFTKHYLTGKGNVSEITLGSDGVSLVVRKVR